MSHDTHGHPRLSSMIILLVGFGLMMLMRWQLAFPGQPIPYFGRFSGLDIGVSPGYNMNN